MNTEQRRLVLRVVAKLMMMGFVIALLYVVMRSLPGRGLQETTNSIDLGQLQTGQTMRYDWNGKRILILKRDVRDLTDMPSLDMQLLDPDSTHSRQPVATENTLRSLTPEYFVVLDYGTDLNCAMEFKNKEEAGPAGRPWQGGFKDLCRGSWYDLSGRVYKGQQAKRNLTIPPYAIEGQSLILGTE